MIRLLTLSFAGAVVFVGFGIPFLLPGGVGLIIGVATAIVGVILFRFTESQTKKSLRENSMWNQTMKADGENLIERDEVD